MRRKESTPRRDPEFSVGECVLDEAFRKWLVVGINPEWRQGDTVHRLKQYELRSGEDRDLIAADMILQRYTPLRVATH